MESTPTHRSDNFVEERNIAQILTKQSITTLTIDKRQEGILTSLLVLQSSLAICVRG